MYSAFFIVLVMVAIFRTTSEKEKVCFEASICIHNGKRRCGLEKSTREVRWFIDKCDLLEFNCEYNKVVFLFGIFAIAFTHGPPQERNNEEDIAMGRKMGPKWCSMAKVCNHDRVPICGISHAGDVMGFRDLCDMFDYNCIRRRNYKQTSCPEDKSVLTVSRRPTSSFYDD